MVGPNGAGKSTAIKCIAGLLRFQGEIFIGPYRNKTLEAKRIFGYIPELPVMCDSPDGLRAFGIYRKGLWGSGLEGAGRPAIERMELSDKAKKLGKELSKGMQQKVSICSACCPGPRWCCSTSPLWAWTLTPSRN